MIKENQVKVSLRQESVVLSMRVKEISLVVKGLAIQEVTKMMSPWKAMTLWKIKCPIMIKRARPVVIVNLVHVEDAEGLYMSMIKPLNVKFVSSGFT